jgi:SNF2 family DNA or RNA helicase
MAKMEDNEKPVLIIQIKAGGVGINLQQFENVFLLSPDWNPTNEIQAISRAHRMGQKKKVSVTRYIITYDTKFRHTRKKEDGTEEIIAIPETTMDQDIMETQKGKYELMEELLDDDSLQFRK